MADDEQDASGDSTDHVSPPDETILTFSGTGPDDALRLKGPDGSVFVLPVTAPLRAALGARTARGEVGATSRPAGAGASGAVPGTPASPREIQARVRAGESAEAVAAALDVSLEHVRRYEGPVLAEREFMAEQAQRARVGHSSDSPALGELVTDRLAARGIDVDALEWDASRPGSTGWLVTVTFTAPGGSRQARWSFNPQTRALKALEDEARWLSETTIADEPIPRRRLAAVRESVFDVATADVSRPGFTRSVLDDVDGTSTSVAADDVPVLHPDAAEVDRAAAQDGSPQTDGSSALSDDATSVLLDALSSRRGVRQHVEIVDDEPDETTHHRGGEEQPAFDFAAPASGAHARDEDVATNARVYALPTPPRGGDETARQDAPATEGVADVAAEAEETDRADGGEASPEKSGPPRQTPPRSGRKGRSKMPSWDEIVFGAKSD